MKEQLGAHKPGDELTEHVIRRVAAAEVWAAPGKNLDFSEEPESRSSWRESTRAQFERSHDSTDAVSLRAHGLMPLTRRTVECSGNFGVEPGPILYTLGSSTQPG